MTSVKLGTLATGFYSAGTTVSDNGLFVVRFPRNPWYNNAWYDKAWYDHMTLISASEDPSIQPLASPFSPFSQFGDKKLASHHPLGSSSSREAEKLAIPHRRTLGFSPGARYVGAFDGVHAFTWSTESFQCLASYRVTNFKYWIINPAVPPPPSCIIPDPISTLPLVGGGSAYAHQSDADAGHDLDESWIKRPFYDLSPSNSEETVELCCLPAATKTSLIQSRFSMWSLVWLNGRQELELQGSYGSVFEDYGPYYGYRVPYDPLGLYRPQSSRDGTRFLVQGRSTAPIVIDISQII
ncbi:uncharacterized protein EI90DRAFT_3045264 [Cantharellus anzutake]|uniref:uncharacterized protein n=1 Tax=Cantharellus anzutake TaxID=1750568 RepID=UPI001905B7B2|nr:uncharacterized protein EI90DRAFT_3094565 [Cantharellus anzutake]XP_038919124.1 uncharacterized protein EI90DRAFT_3045264 [Cantharellus anzutake]KAF8312155.1 hypothetical protein EI90DRAFT_3094565 [Cantharellus anzutake]KAF8336311.1 hypothetical protein EI90DRAFT_3045264 [Cantharellus anzutake]